MTELKNYLENQKDLIDRELELIFKIMTGENPLKEAMRYSLMAGGKRLRPILCLATFEIFTSTKSTGSSHIDSNLKISRPALRTACALEMIHTYSLIHDDLPAMDNDSLRRGKATSHIAFNEATAILSGDALLTFAFQLLSLLNVEDSSSENDIDPNKTLQIIEIISAAAGFQGMIEGQARDILAQTQSLTIDQLEKLHQLKTGRLIEASVLSGAIWGNASPDEIKKLKSYSQNLGLAFQVYDDILNAEGNPELMGKAVGTDKELGKSTFPILLGLTESKTLSKKLIQKALQELDTFDNRADRLRELAQYIIMRDH